MRKVVVVDFDGVILRNRAANQYISSRIKTYVERKLQTKNKNITDKIAGTVYRDHKYTEHGYTSMADFSYHVYNSPEAQTQYRNIQMTDEEVTQWRTFNNMCDSRDVDVLIYSNCPINWVHNFIPSGDIKTLVLCEYLESFRYSNIKPSTSIVTNFVREKYKRAYFVDDSLSNLTMLTGNSFYTRVWFDSIVDVDKPVWLNQDFWAISKLEHIEHFIT
jgi:hypothetical protein